MKNLSKFMFAMALLGTLSLSACKDDDDGPGDNCGNDFNFYTELNAEAMELSDAATAYGQNPTTENCEIYRQAFLDYLDAARDLEDCAQLYDQFDEYQQAIDQAEQSLENLQC